MSRWFRHYAGLCRDEKLVGVAIKCRQPIERVVWVWAAILESAAEIDDGGRYVLDAAEVAYFLRADDAEICAIEGGLIAAGRVEDGSVAKWGSRQFQSDRSRERIAAHRARKSEASRNCDVTLQKRYRNAPETDTDTDISSLRSDIRADAPKKSAKPSPRKILEATLSPEMADGVIEHRNRMRKPLTAIAAEGLAKALALAPDPNAAARTMIERGWQGFKLEWLTNDRQRAGPSQSQNPYLAIAAELGAFGRAADYDDITQAAGPYASEPSASRYAGDLSQPRGADHGDGRVLDLVAVRAVRG